MNDAELVVVVGAGYSKPAGGPLLNELLDQKFLSTSRVDQMHLRALTQHAANLRKVGDATLEDVFTDLWARASTGGDLQLGQRRFDAERLIWALQNHLSSVCGDIRFAPHDPLAELYQEYWGRVANDYSLITVVSFNYDLLLEQTLDSADVAWDYGNSKDLVFSNADRQEMAEGAHVQLLKLHGSSNWGLCRGCQAAEKEKDVITAFEKPYVGWLKRKTCEYCRDNLLELGIVPPVHGKAGQVQYMQSAWREARQRLRNATDLLIVGYSLPASDTEAHLLLSEAHQSSRLEKVKVVCGVSDAKARYEKVLPDHKNLGCYFEDYLLDRTGI